MIFFNKKNNTLYTISRIFTKKYFTILIIDLHWMVLKPRQPCSGKRYIYALCEVCLELSEYKTEVILFLFFLFKSSPIYICILL
jgi:hypothetical protein